MDMDQSPTMGMVSLLYLPHHKAFQQMVAMPVQRTYLPPFLSPLSRYQDRIDLGYEFSQTLLKKLAHAVTPLGAKAPDSFDGKLVYIMGNTTCEPKPGNALSLQIPWPVI